LDGATYQTSPNIRLTAGVQNVTVKDATGCTASTGSVTITQPATPLQVTAEHIDASCNGANDGSITAAATGGYDASYMYGIAGAYQPSNVFNNIAAGTYKITVQDANNCVAFTNVVIKQPLTPCSSLSSTPAGPSSNTGAMAGELKVKVYPNPAVIEFNLQVISGNSKKVVELRVMDMTGKTVYQTRGSVYDMYKFGRTFAAGMYVAEILNGEQVQRIKLVKGN
jgi:hypothetical protein